MISTVVFAAVFLGLLFASIVLWAMCLRLGLQWAKVPEVTTRQVVKATTVTAILQIAQNVFFLSIMSPSIVVSTALLVAELAAVVIVPCIVIRTVFKTRFRHALQAWLPTLLATVTTLAFTYLILRPFLYESFVVPTNAMAPTIVGQHWQGKCSKCGRFNYCSPRHTRFGKGESPPLLMICDNFHVTEVSEIDKTVHSGDRFLVAKFFTPRRWDLVVFQYPEEPTMLYVKRLVGFPGERIHIQDGSVWVNDERQEPPDAIDGIEYLSELPGVGPILSGSATRPALLRNDEYFVVGDFSAQSSDSRSWERGAAGYNRYAVPKSFITGVVTHTFWPLARWRIHR